MAFILRTWVVLSILFKGALVASSIYLLNTFILSILLPGSWHL
jgi:hypothetical protein